MIENNTLNLARRFPKFAQAILNAFRNNSDRERAEKILRDNGVALDWSGHHPRDLEL